MLNIIITISNGMCYTMLYMLEWMRKKKHKIRIPWTRELRGSALSAYIHEGILKGYIFIYIYIYIYIKPKLLELLQISTSEWSFYKPLLSTKPNPTPLLSTLLTKHRTSTLSQTQIRAISQKACKGTTMGANVFNLRPSLHIRAFSLGISQLIYE